MPKKQKESKPQGFSPNIVLMVGGLNKFVEENNYTVGQARMFYSIIKASLQDSFNTWTQTHTIADLPMVATIGTYEKKEGVSQIFKDLQGDIVNFIETQAATANVENFMLALNEVSSMLDNSIIVKHQDEPKKDYEHKI